MSLDRSQSSLLALHRLAQEIGRAESLQEIHAASLECLHAALGVSRSAILLYDDSGVMRFVAWRALSELYREAVEGHSPWAQNDPQPRPVAVASALEEPSLASYHAVLRREGIGALAFVPLVYGRELLGKFMLYFDEPHDFTPCELGIAETIASQIGFAIARTRTLTAERAARERAESSAKMLSELQSVTAALSAAHTTEAVAEVVVTRGARATRARGGMFFVLQPEQQTLALLRAHGFSDERQQLVSRLALTERIPVADAVREQKPIWIERFETFARAYPEAARRLARGRDSEAFACIPVITSTNTVRGVVVFSYPEPRSFDVEARAFMQALVDQGALAFGRAELFERTEREVRAREQVLGMVAHDLRTPLSVLSMKAMTMLQRSPPDERRRTWRKDAEVMLRNTAHMERLIRDLLDFTRIEAGSLRVECDTYSVAELVAQAVETIQPASKGRSLSVAIEPEGARAFCDRERTLQILTNLLGNAIKFTSDEGQIAVVAQVRDGAVEISVRDDGTGIPREELPHIFDRHFQSSRDSKRRRDGIGLGLFIARALVEAQGGRIWAHSEPGRGSTFSFTMRAAETTATTEGRPPVVMVIDDDTSFRDELNEILTDEGWEVVASANGAEALHYLASNPPPNLILLDLKMPVMDGWAVFGHLKTDPVLATVPTVIMSGMDPDEVQPSLVGATHYYEKPIGLSQLLDLTGAYCSRA